MAGMGDRAAYILRPKRGYLARIARQHPPADRPDKDHLHQRLAKLGQPLRAEDALGVIGRVHPREFGSHQRCVELERAEQHLARSEEHTSELQSLMRISYAVVCLNQKTRNEKPTSNNHNKISITH